MATVIKKNEVEMPENVRKNVTVTKFEDTLVDENGNLKAVGRRDNLPYTGGQANATIVEEFESAEVDENGNIIVHRKPDFAR